MQKARAPTSATTNGFGRLKAGIIDTGLCTRCGACSAVCLVEAISHSARGMVLKGECIDCGNCLRACPGRGLDIAEFEKRLFRRSHRPTLAPNGSYLMRRNLVASDSEVFRKGYFGGRVSAVLIGALERGDIDAALLTDWSGGRGLSIGKGRLARSRSEILALAGSKYVFSDVLSLLPEVSRDPSIGKVAVVCLPCQVQALRKMGADSVLGPLVAKVRYIVSLNCGAPMVDEEEWGSIIEEMTGVDAAKVRGFEAFKTSALNIRFRVHDGVSTKEFDIPIYRYLRRIDRGRIWDRCLMCGDYSGELSDITFGAPLVRTERGKELLERAVAEGRLVRPGLKRRAFQDLMDTYWAIKKKRRARSTIKKRQRKGLKVPD